MPPSNAQVDNSGPKWRLFALTVVLLLLVTAAFVWAFPTKRALAWLALYTIPSHMFISPFPHEPMLLYYSKSFGAFECAVASLIGCLMAGVWDYWLFIPLVHHRRVRPRYARTSLYKKSVKLFRISPFWALVIFGFVPVPFYAAKFLSIADGYPLKRYLVALVVGRTPRYYALAYLGYVLKLPNWSLIVLALTILVVTLYKNRPERKRAPRSVETAARYDATSPHGKP